MAFTLRTPRTATGTTSVVLTKPTGTVAGDLLLAVIDAASLSLPTITAPGGWMLIDTQVNSTVRSGLWYHVAGSSEPASYTFSVSTSFPTSAGIINAIAGANQTNPIGEENTSLDASATTNHLTPSITPGSDGNLIFVATARMDGVTSSYTPSWPAGWTGLANVNNSFNAIATGDLIQTTAAPVSVTVGTSAGVAAQFQKYILAVRPDSLSLSGADSLIPVLTSDGVIEHSGAESLVPALTTAGRVIPQERAGQPTVRTGLPAISLHLHTPLPDARPLAGLWLATAQTSLRIVTSVEHGDESCAIGFPQRTKRGVMIPALLETAVGEWADMGHVLVADGARRLFGGRLAAQPQFPGGQLRAFTAQGYWAMLNDGIYTSDVLDLWTTGAVILDMLSQRMPFVRILASRWIDPGVLHAPNEFTEQPPGSSISSMLNAGDGLGTPWDLQFWLAQDGSLTASLLPRLAPDVPDYECDWDETVNISYDPLAICSHVAVRHTPPGEAEHLTEWQPLLSDGTFQRLHGYTRQKILDGGQLTLVGAEAFRDTQQILLSQRQWSGTITVGVRSSMVLHGTRISVLPRDLVAGQWLRVRGHNEGLLLIQRTDYDAATEVVQLTVGQGIIARSLHEKMLHTIAAVNAARNPLSGARA